MKTVPNTFLSQILPTPPQVVAGWIDLPGQHAVEGAGPFDLQIIATMLANSVQRIYTFNPGDFRALAELTAVTPSQQARTAGGQKTAREPFSAEP